MTSVEVSSDPIGDCHVSAEAPQASRVTIAWKARVIAKVLPIRISRDPISTPDRRRSLLPTHSTHASAARTGGRLRRPPAFPGTGSSRNLPDRSKPGIAPPIRSANTPPGWFTPARQALAPARDSPAGYSPDSTRRDSERARRSRHPLRKYASRAPRPIATFRRRCFANRLCVSLHHPGDDRIQSCRVACSLSSHPRRRPSSNLNGGRRQSADHRRCSANLLCVSLRHPGDDRIQQLPGCVLFIVPSSAVAFEFESERWPAASLPTIGVVLRTCCACRCITLAMTEHRNLPVPCSLSSRFRRCPSSNLNDGGRQSTNHRRFSPNLLSAWSRYAGDRQKRNCRATGYVWRSSSVSSRRALRPVRWSGQSWSWQSQFAD